MRILLDIYGGNYMKFASKNDVEKRALLTTVLDGYRTLAIDAIPEGARILMRLHPDGVWYTMDVDPSQCEVLATALKEASKRSRET